MDSRLVHLKIKIETASLEAKRIRQEELRWARKLKRARERELPTNNMDQIRESLYLHRTGSLRQHTRSLHLAYGFLKGNTYISMEKNASTAFDLLVFVRNINKFGYRLSNKENANKLGEWLVDAVLYLRKNNVYVSDSTIKYYLTKDSDFSNLLNTPLTEKLGIA